MSWVFLADDKVYKLKKPVCFPYLDFSTLAKREAACRAELRLNRRLASDVYLDLAPLRMSGCGFSIGGEKGLVVDWLVLMRRLDERSMLEHAIVAGRIATWQLDQLAGWKPSFQLESWWSTVRRAFANASSFVDAKTKSWSVCNLPCPG
jgi:uncharacterized protein